MFNLTRYFSALSFALIVLVGAVLGSFLREREVSQLMRMAEDRNVAMTQVFRNAMWRDFADLAVEGIPPTTAALLRHAADHDVQRKVAALMRDSDVVKVKVYNLAGLTVFSSDPRQIGEDKQANAGFAAARGGTVATELTHRNQFDAFEGVVADIDVISSYVPVRDHASGALVGVMEVYQNVTPFVRQLDRAVWEVWLAVAGLLGGLYLVQLLVVRHAQAVLRRQEAALEAANRELDNRVRQRTTELQAEVAERRAAEARLDHLAHHDPLTGLPNRLMFQTQMKASLARAARAERQLALLFIDLDRFKEVNDTLGHAIGDELLVAAARRLTERLRGGDALARFGGDEFICIIEEIETAHEAADIADQIVALLSRPFMIEEHELFIAASVGISLYPADGADAETLVRNADTAMYQAKAHGRGRSHFYAAEMTLYAQERIRLERLLRHAIAAGETAVHYQLKVDIEGRPVGAEALARWTSAELGAVSPVRFIPLAEETGFILELGAWVLRAACRQMMAWRADGLALRKISVNLSVKQTERGDIVETVRAILAETGLEPAALELEITESLIMNADDALATLDRLHRLGVSLAIDDFGTGYSSLAYLKQLPIDTLKIDRSFVVGIGENSGDEAIIRAVVALARSLGLATVAEGVDRPHQVAFLRAHGCDQIQGYFFGKPLPADEFAAAWRRDA